MRTSIYLKILYQLKNKTGLRKKNGINYENVLIITESSEEIQVLIILKVNDVYV